MDRNAKPKITILDYGMGNLRSVARAWEAAGAETQLVDTPEDVDPGTILVFPGQGAIGDTMQRLKARGWDTFLHDWIGQNRPFFGICLGLQALFSHSEEADTPGLGIFQGRVRRFDFPLNSGLKIPHMGWNTVQFQGKSEWLESISPSEAHFYFVHSYYVECEDPTLQWGQTTYGELNFCSAITRGNLVATQFHPEKSQKNGLQLYKNFLEKLTTTNRDP